MIGSVLGSTQGLTEQERQARVDLVSSVVAGIAASGGLDATSAGNAAKIEGENNQVAPVPLPGMGMAGGASQDLPPGIPGYKGEERREGDGVIADPATELDSATKAGPLVTLLPEPKAVEVLITASPAGKIKQLVEAVLNAVAGGGDKYQTLDGKSIQDLSDAAKVPDASDKSGELSSAGRALQKARWTI
ncbi:hypothetical protein GIY62_07055 [Burkholderia plantarii]|uniref:hypothetical protein n=1 Tax=Burkholderia plantarii TaxID=41899 RepID=UPI00272CA728|nr:hypothetical protein [Burkholderia plantarii]WLE60402.1 hypothetical protein GIY62_07055 [Burkholderia plantarii]